MTRRTRKTASASIFSQPQVRAVCNGVPVHTYGYTHVLAAAPDLVDDAAQLQAGNRAPLAKRR